MSASRKVVRQSVTLPSKTALQVRGLARKRRVSANRVLVELVEEGIKAQKRRQEHFFELTRQLRAAADPEEVERLGNELGRMVFGE